MSGVKLVDDLLKGNILFAVGIGAAALVLPKLLPALSPPLRTAVKNGLHLFVEAESEAEGDIIERLAEAALKDILQHLSGSGAEDQRRHAAQDAVDTFRRTAHRRAHRYARNEGDCSARYHRHLGALRRRLRQAHRRHEGAMAAALETLSRALADEQTR